MPLLPVIVTLYVPEGPRHESPTIVEKARLNESLLSEHVRPDGEIEREVHRTRKISKPGDRYRR